MKTKGIIIETAAQAAAIIRAELPKVQNDPLHNVLGAAKYAFRKMNV